ncbi:NADH-quinone oxidoreductase subunit C [Candidatus Uhrbacteria bacterium]|nr:NADH-quinone oxidoreductase subunit C [Candidatus Uhrbacteria bacterium]
MTATEILRHQHLEVSMTFPAAMMVTTEVSREEFARTGTMLVQEHGFRLVTLFADDARVQQQAFALQAIFSHDATHERVMVRTLLPEHEPRYPALTATVMAAHWYERYAMDMFGIVAEGHPDPRRLVHHENIPEGTWPLRKDFAWDTRLAHADVPHPMHHVAGEGIYEIPVGPIHAGIIEPGHFRFNVAGERIVTLEGKLFFTHKGVEKIVEGKTIAEALPFVERISGDMAAAHALAFCQAVEMAAVTTVPVRAAWIRALLLELERITMHMHDLANIAGNGTGYTIMAAQGFRVKERLMQCAAAVVGNRFWRGYIVPGGVREDLPVATLQHIAGVVRSACDEMRSLLTMALTSDALRERLETTGILPQKVAEAYGAVGIAARASGVDIDVRRDYADAAYAMLVPEMTTETAGDVFARYMIRVRELEVSAKLVERIIRELPSGTHRATCDPDTGFGFGAVESWRGEIATTVTIHHGVIERCFPRDPSFCNWALFGELGPGNIVPDFPLCNKSLNLSYSGTDL